MIAIRKAGKTAIAWGLIRNAIDQKNIDQMRFFFSIKKYAEIKMNKVRRPSICPQTEPSNITTGFKVYKRKDKRANLEFTFLTIK